MIRLILSFLFRKWGINLSYSITFKESVWRDLNKIDKHQVKIILAKIEDLLPGGVKVILHLQDNFLSYGNGAFGTIEWFIPLRKTPSWLHASNTGKMYIVHEKNVIILFHSKSFQETSSSFFTGRHTMWDIHSSFPWIPAWAGMTFLKYYSHYIVIPGEAKHRPGIQECFYKVGLQTTFDSEFG